MSLELGLIFILGLVSSLHCVQMCGPIVLAFSLPLSRSQALRAQLHYNAGRILTYAALGALAGALGGGIGLLGRLAGLASGARVFAGSAMIKDETTCIRCAMCASRCPTHAILMKHFDFHRACVTVPTRNPKVRYA